LFMSVRVSAEGSELRSLANHFVKLLEAAFLVGEKVDDVLANGLVILSLERPLVGLGRIVTIHIGDDVDDDLEWRLPIEVLVLDGRHELLEHSSKNLIGIDLFPAYLGPVVLDELAADAREQRHLGVDEALLEDSTLIVV